MYKGLVSRFKDKRDFGHLMQIAGSFIFRAGAVLISFLSVRFAVKELAAEEYGVWLTIYSVASWIFLLDGGLGNGLKNKLTESLVQKDDIRSRSLVSTAYFGIAFLMFAFVAIIMLCSVWIDFGRFFNVSDSLVEATKWCFLLVVVNICVKFIFDLINSIFLAYQRAAYVHLMTFLSSLLTYLLLVFVLPVLEVQRLIFFGLVMTGGPLLFYLGTNIYFFYTEYKLIRPSFPFFKKEFLSDLLNLGLKFFVIQISVLIIFSSDNFIIVQLFGPESVTAYNLAYKLYSAFTIVWAIILTPYWTAFTDAYHRDDIAWIRQSVARLIKVWLLLLLGVIVVTVFVDDLYRLWLGEDPIVIEKRISISMALFIILSTFTNIYVYVINGVGKIKLQLISSIIIGVLNIPLSILFAKYFGLGVSGIMYATCFCVGLTPIINYIQYKKIVLKTDQGIWGK